MAINELYQYSIMSALMDGVASHGIPFADVLAHGDLGLGTFKNMDGEMILVDGKVYQMKADGSVFYIESPEDTITPFATVTRFQPTIRTRSVITGEDGLKDFAYVVVFD
jgi:alpha-acetolactate decarboxylase